MFKRLCKMLQFVLLFALVVGCGSSSEGEDHQESSVSTGNQEGHVVIVESGYTQDEEYVHFGFVIKNEDTQKTFQYSVVTMTAYDADDQVLGTTDQTMNYICPNEVQAFGSVFEVGNNKVARVDFEVDDGDVITDTEDLVKVSDLEISGTNERKDKYLGYSFVGKVANNSQHDTENIAVVAVLKKKDKIVYADLTYVENVKAGKQKAFEINAFYDGKYDTVDYYTYCWDI